MGGWGGLASIAFRVALSAPWEAAPLVTTLGNLVSRYHRGHALGALLGEKCAANQVSRTCYGLQGSP